MPKLRIKVPAIIEGGRTHERELLLMTDGEGQAVLMLTHDPFQEVEPPSVICHGEEATLRACFAILKQEFEKSDPIAHQLLGLPLIDMEERRRLIPHVSAKNYLRALERFADFDAEVRSDLWNDHLARVAMHATGDVVLDAGRMILPRRTPTY